MANNSTTARPYAKAAFEYAQANKAFDVWSDSLAILAQAAAQPEALAAAKHPKISREQRLALFSGVLGKKADSKVLNFVSVLAENDRLSALPEINEQFAFLRSELESSLEGTITSAQEITEKQKEAIIDVLSKRLDKSIKLETAVDESLIGGVKIKIGDFVIDGSVKAKLEKMAGALAG